MNAVTGMARPLRIQEAGLSYHVHARGNGRMPIYRDDDDRHKFLDVLTRVVDRYRVDCHAHCEMTTHYHLVVTTADANLSAAMKQLNGDYAQWWNRRHEHVGHVFQGRFVAQIVQTETHLLTVCRYVVLNPVRARITRSPEEWLWSSYRATAGLTEPPAFLKLDMVLRLLGGEDVEVARRRYRDFVGDLEGVEGEAAALPDCPVLGDPTFVARFNGWREDASREVPRRERNSLQPLEALFADAITRKARRERVAEACHLGYSISEIAGYLQVHRSTVAKLVGAEAVGVRPRKTQQSQT